jgi:hypothetical protein
MQGIITGGKIKQAWQFPRPVQNIIDFDLSGELFV